MEQKTKPVITVNASVSAPLEKVWDYFTKPEHIIKWNQASDDWHSPHAENDLRVGGKFKTGMAAKNGSAAFDFEGEYTTIEDKKTIAYRLADGRQVEIQFHQGETGVDLVETFEAEATHSEELQKGGWQAILDSFKTYVENN